MSSDVLYKTSVDNWNLRADRFNVPFRHPTGGYCDVFFVFNASFVKPFEHLLRTWCCPMMHDVNLTKYSLLPHLMFSRRRYNSDTCCGPNHLLNPENNNPLYVLLRTRRWGHKEVDVIEKQNQERGHLWWLWRIVRLLRSRGGSFFAAVVLAACACACVWAWRLRRRGARAECSPAVVIANSVWLVVPVWLVISLYGDAFQSPT